MTDADIADMLDNWYEMGSFATGEALTLANLLRGEPPEGEALEEIPDELLSALLLLAHDGREPVRVAANAMLSAVDDGNDAVRLMRAHDALSDEREEF